MHNMHLITIQLLISCSVMSIWGISCHSAGLFYVAGNYVVHFGILHPAPAPSQTPLRRRVQSPGVRNKAPRSPSPTGAATTALVGPGAARLFAFWTQVRGSEMWGVAVAAVAVEAWSRLRAAERLAPHYSASTLPARVSVGGRAGVEVS